MSRIRAAAIGAAFLGLSFLAAGPVLAQSEQDQKDLQKAKINLAMDPGESAQLLEGIISKYMKEAGAAKMSVLEVNTKKLNRLSASKRDLVAEAFYWRSLLAAREVDALVDAMYAVAIAPRPRAEYFLQRGILSAEDIPANAIQDLNMALDLSASDGRLTGEILEQRGRIHLARGRADEALPDFGRAIELAKGDTADLARLRGLRASAWEVKGDLPKAIEDLTAAALGSLYPEEFILRRAKLYRAQDDHVRALQDYEEVLKKNQEALEGGGEDDGISPAIAGILGLNADRPRRNLVEIRIDALLGRAAVSYDLKQYKQALDDYDEILKLDPDRADAYRGRSYVLRSLGDRAGALASINKAMEIAPSKTSYFGNRADIHFFIGEYEKAAADYAEFLAAYPKAPFGHQRRGVCLQNLGDLRGAIGEYERTIELDPRNLIAYNNLAWIKATSPDAKLREGAKAVEYGKKALELAGQVQPWLYMDTLAAAYAEAGDFRQAVDLLTKALALMTKPEDQKDQPDMEARLKLFQAGKPFREKPGPDRRP